MVAAVPEDRRMTKVASSALFGPLAVAGVLALRGEYQLAFAALVVPALATLALLAVARLIYPRPQDMGTNPPNVNTTGVFRWFYWFATCCRDCCGPSFRAGSVSDPTFRC